MSASFVHLHLHTSYSLLDGMIRPAQLAARAAELGMPAVAMTDHGNLYGAIDFYTACKKHHVRPILGCEIYLAPYSLHQKQEFPNRKRATHLTLLAHSNTGWHNLIKLVTCGHLEGMWYGKPRVDREALARYSEGLLCLSGCISGPVNEWLLLGETQRAIETLAELRDIFGKENTFVEIHNHGLEAQLRVLPQLAKLAGELKLPLVAANDVHFLDQSDHDAHDVMICIGTGHLLLDQNRMRYSPEVYFKTAEQMRELFADYPGACDMTLEIAERCQVDIQLDPTSSEKYPQFPTPDGSPREEYLLQLCRKKLSERYPPEKAADPEVRARLEYEVKTINALGFASYFLITADFIQWAREHDIPVGPGRGSAAGSLVAYVLGITDICPLRFGLLFERFLNPERVSPPDVDIDFCQTRRPEVIDYVRRKYGERSVSHIITYGTMGAKSVLRDVARVMGISYGEADRIAKMIDPGPNVSLASEWEKKPELRELIASSALYGELWRYATKLEGLNRNVGVHPAGIVIGDRPLDEHVPLTRGNEGEVVTQYDMSAITEVGLLKMDFLGLKNLTVIHEALAHIRRKRGPFELKDIPLDDAKTFALLNRGETMGIFQLESGGMKNTCQSYEIASIDDIIDLIAVYRPGAMQFIDRMLQVKKGLAKPTYEHPLLEQVCGSTYGVMIYQEQVQNAAKLLAGYTLGGADLLRRAMGKKDREKMAKERARFIAGCAQINGIGEALSSAIFDKIEMFAGYGFNKSHSACYGHISYWTAWLKANYPVEFMAAVLSSESHDNDKIGKFIAECQRMNIEILPPDLNCSQLRFTPEHMPSGKVAIRYGLGAIKNVGEAAMQSALAERERNGPFLSIENFALRLDSKCINRRILENLIKAGAFDWTGEYRASMAARLEWILSSASALHRDRSSGQSSLFEALEAEPLARPPGPITNYCEEWPKDERLSHEKELLGFYLTGHPLDKYRHLLDSDRYEHLGALDELDASNPRERYAFAGMIRSLEAKSTKAGKPFGVMVLEDFSGSAEVMLWGETYIPARDSGLLQTGRVIRLKASIQLDDRTGQRRLTGYEIAELKLRRNSSAKHRSLELLVTTHRHDLNDLQEIDRVLRAHPGNLPVLLHVQNSSGRRATLALPITVKKSPALFAALERYLEES